jgi:hypothetical protein
LIWKYSRSLLLDDLRSSENLTGWKRNSREGNKKEREGERVKQQQQKRRKGSNYFAANRIKENSKEEDERKYSLT